MELKQLLDQWLGLQLEPKNLELQHVCLRATVIFVSALVMLRLAHKRFFARRNAVDVLLTLVIASTLARAINGNAPFFPTIGVGFLLVFMHRLLTWASVRFPGFEKLVKGSPTPLVDNGEVQTSSLRKHDVSMDDLEEDLRLKGTANVAQVRHALLERNGEISVIRS
jgi:uncharacterized membrane protein YcaP (DUF421 family)